MGFVEQQHLEPVRSERNRLPYEWIEIHTYYEPVLALFSIKGDTDQGSGSVDLWLNEAEVRKLRDALDTILGEHQ